MKKRVIFNALMFLLICALGYLLYTQIEEPIAFEKTKEARREAVVNQLIEIRKAQEAYRGITGKFAPSFKHLVDTLQYGRFALVKVIGDIDDPDNSNISYDTSYIAAIDSVQKMGLKLEGIGIVPFTNNVEFEIVADTMSYQSTEIEVVEVGTPWKTFMGKFAHPKFKKFDALYDPNSKIKFGSLDKPILAGSWE